MRAMTPRFVMPLALLLCSGGCTRTPSLASGPIELDTRPTLVRFERPVPVSGTGWELCFEFSRPGDSHDAGRIEAVLIGAGGARHALTESHLDRRGEAVVCRVGSLPSAGSAVLEAVELSAPAGIRLRGLRGGGRP